MLPEHIERIMTLIGKLTTPEKEQVSSLLAQWLSEVH